MEIELTSQRDDGAFTWRAAGAREPRGIIEAAKAGTAAKVGDVLRVEAEIELDGITIASVIPSKAKASVNNRIEILAPKTAPPGVTSTLVEKKGGRARSGGFDREDRADRARPRRSDKPDFLRRDGTPARPARASRAGGGRGSQGGRPSAGPGGVESPPDGSISARSTFSRASAPARGRTRPARLVEGTAHRDAFYATLPAEQRPIAEQLAIGGLPAVRRAIAEEQTAAKAAGRPRVSEDGIVAIADQLLAGVREAVWLDRADAAVKALETISLRDLRAVVAGAAPRDDSGRELLRQLREAHEARLNKLRTSWTEEVQRAITEGRILQALRLSGRLPEPSARFPASLVEPLAEAASASLNPDIPADRWIALLEAASASPVRRIIKPLGLPRDDASGVRQAAAASAGRIPALAGLLGLSMPPPPGPPGAKSPSLRRPPRPRPGRSGAPIPPPPKRVGAAANAPAPGAPANEGTTEVVPAPVDVNASNAGPTTDNEGAGQVATDLEANASKVGNESPSTVASSSAEGLADPPMTSEDPDVAAKTAPKGTTPGADQA
ncbi:MAG TPA: hypothetical protein VG368_01665 [Acidimicrobiales bacterium]|nr:hypothetical protein [Acidimicrobiales bacterium]